MSGYDPEAVLRTAGNRPAAGRVPWVMLAFLLVGIAAFLYGAGNGQAQRAWIAFLVNLVFWTGLACGTVMFSAVLVVTKANWGRPLKRLAEAPVLFLPVAFVLFWVLFIGKDHLYSWIQEPLYKKAAWLNTGFFFARDGAALFILAAAGTAMVFLGIRRDQRMLARPYGRHPGEASDEYRRPQMILANIFGISFGFLLSLLAFDLIMSLDPHWYSTLFGAYYFAGSFFTGLAALFILGFIAKRRLGLQEFIRPLHLHNLGKLLLGFCLLTADFFYAQFFIYWYGNVPEETGYILDRVRDSPWKPVSWTVLIVCFALPFFILLSRRIKMKHGFMAALSIMILAGMWLERFLLVAPSVWHGQRLPLGWLELSITLGFFGIMGLCVWWFLHRYPLLAVSDPLFWKGLERVSAHE